MPALGEQGDEVAVVQDRLTLDRVGDAEITLAEELGPLARAFFAEWVDELRQRGG